MSGRTPSPSHVTIGKVVGPHGIKGGLKIQPQTDFFERFEPGSVVYLNGEPVTITRLTSHKTQVRIETKEVLDRNTAEALKWAKVSVPAEDLPELDDDEFYTADLIGLDVVNVEGKKLGVVKEIFPSPAHDILVIGDTMIPIVKEFVKEIDLDEGRIVVAPIPGMFETE